MEHGMIFDIYQDGKPTKRVMAINEFDVISLETLEVIKGIDFENEVESILIENILTY